MILFQAPLKLNLWCTLGVR